MAGKILTGLALVLLVACSNSRSATPQQQQRVMAMRCQTADQLWARAEAMEAKNPAAAAGIFKQITDSYPEHERAAEARFRQGRAYYRARIWDESIMALQDYMLIAPVNQHLAEVEEMLYQAGRCGVRGGGGGFLGLGDGKAVELGALKYVAQTFPAGNYPDDALLALGEYYFQDEDYANAALHYRELLIRYPDSEWSFRARLRLADTYLARDKGTPYNAGFVQVDPRENIPAEMALQTATIQPAVLLALEQYELFLERMRADPSRSAEYASEIQYATRRAQEARERVACKELNRGDWYAGRGDLCGAMTFWRLAASRTGTRSGTTARQRLAARRQPVSR